MGHCLKWLALLTMTILLPIELLQVLYLNLSAGLPWSCCPASVLFLPFRSAARCPDSCKGNAWDDTVGFESNVKQLLK